MPLLSPILYEDRDILLCRKEAGIPSCPDPSGRADLLSVLVERHPTAKLVHRLDTQTGGVMVFGLTSAATARLCALVQDHERFCKEYLAVVPAPLPTPAHALKSYLYHDKQKNKTFEVDTPRKGVKEARLTYRTIVTAENGRTLILVRLQTGRTHQIRAQFASIAFPLIGDGKYGSRERCPNIGLWAYRLTFPHPMTGQKISVEALPDAAVSPWNDFADVLQTPIPHHFS